MMTTFTDHVPTGGELEIVVIALSDADLTVCELRKLAWYIQ